MNLLNDLLFKCVKYELDFSYDGNLGAIHIFGTLDSQLVTVGQGYIKDWRWSDPEEVLMKLHRDVDNHINKLDFETEYAQATLTERERKMKESGHKESDFS